MNNYELHSRAQELADTHDKYRLARKLIVAEEELAEFRQSQKAQVEAVGYVLPTGIRDLKKDHPATIYAPDNAMVPGSYPIWLYEHPPAPAAVPDSDQLAVCLENVLSRWTPESYGDQAAYNGCQMALNDHRRTKQ